MMSSSFKSGRSLLSCSWRSWQELRVLALDHFSYWGEPRQRLVKIEHFFVFLSVSFDHSLMLQNIINFTFENSPSHLIFKGHCQLLERCYFVKLLGHGLYLVLVSRAKLC